jgi:tetratricopeptide (TPR) repeat protein
VSEEDPSKEQVSAAATPEDKKSSPRPTLGLPRPTQQLHAIAPGAAGLPAGLLRSSLSSLPAVKPSQAAEDAPSTPKIASAAPQPRPVPKPLFGASEEKTTRPTAPIKPLPFLSKPISPLPKLTPSPEVDDSDDDGVATSMMSAGDVPSWSLSPEDESPEVLGAEATSAEDELGPATVEIEAEDSGAEDSGPPTDNISADQIVSVIEEATQAERSALLDATPLAGQLDPAWAAPDEATMMSPGLLDDDALQEDDADDLDGHTQVLASPLEETPAGDVDGSFDGDEKTSIVVSQVALAPRAPETQTSGGFGALSAPHDPKPLFPVETSGLNSRPKPTLLEFQYGAAPTAADPVASAALSDLPEDDDDLDGLKTEMLVNPFTQDAVAPRIKVVDGPAAGQESFVNGLKCSIGRGEQNTFIVNDPAMSRNHFEILRTTDESFLVKDLGSANGIALQGTRIKEAQLFNGDRIEAGHSTFEFCHAQSLPRGGRHIIYHAGETLSGALPSPVMMGAQTGRVFTSADASQRFFTMVTIAAAVVCIPLIVVLLYLSTREPASQPAAPVTSAAPSVGAQSAELFMSGVQAVKEREWDQAKADFKRAKALNPELDIEPQLKRIERERAAKQRLDQANAAGAAGDIEQAHKLASEIEADSVYAEDAKRWLRRARLSGVDAQYASAQRQFTDDDLDGALKTLEGLLKEAPDHQGSKDLRAKIVERQLDLERQRQEQEARAAREAQQPTREVVTIKDPFASERPTTEKATPEKAVSQQADWGEGNALYRSQKLVEAAAFFEKVAVGDAPARAQRAKRMASDMRLLHKTWREAQALLDKDDWGAASKKLEVALDIDKRLGGAHKKALSEKHGVALARMGFVAFKKEDYRQARKMLLESRKSSSNSVATELDQELEKKAAGLYVQAAQARKTNDMEKASALCRTIMLMVPSSSPSYAKAQRLLLD